MGTPLKLQELKVHPRPRALANCCCHPRRPVPHFRNLVSPTFGCLCVASRVQLSWVPFGWAPDVFLLGSMLWTECRREHRQGWGTETEGAAEVAEVHSPGSHGVLRGAWCVPPAG
ncbi:hypothetical protein H1C71_035873 [Ictidomys tridecemlineatus]|nr:hypothetical protein H1C71_035873 [Ictidomys tridecemlineatus]